MDRTKKQLRTPISYYGGMQHILKYSLPLFPVHTVYTETFFGGGSEFWAKIPAPNETINDKLDMVINFYRQLRSNYRPLKKMIDETLLSRTMHRQAQAWLRVKSKATPVQRAWAFWMCSNFSFSNKIGAGIKFSNKMDTVVPAVMKRKKQEFTELLVARIENVHIENNDALVILNSRNTPEAFHRLDPPYPPADQGHYKGYGYPEFEKLLQWCAGECKGKFLLSNYNSPMLTEYTAVHGWNKLEIKNRVQAPNIKSTIKDRTELLIWNYDVNEGQQKLF